MKTRYLLLTLFILIASSLSAQTTLIQGDIKHDNGDSLIGASVYNRFSQSGVISDIDGSFELSVTSGRSDRYFLCMISDPN